MDDPDDDLRKWLKMNYPEEEKIVETVRLETPGYDLMDACDRQFPHIYNEWCESS